MDKGYGSASDELHLLYPASNVARFHLHSDDACEHDRPISILKLHGSLNWVVRLNSKRPPASFLKGEGPAKEIHLLIRREISERQHYARKGAGRKRWDLWPIVVPPVYAKHELRTQILDGVWADAKSALRAAARLASECERGLDQRCQPGFLVSGSLCPRLSETPDPLVSIPGSLF